MQLAIMQPYLFPYIGYFQLIHSVDKFVIYDDVQFIKGGWINRNYILLNNDRHLFSFGVRQRDSHLLPINERFLGEHFPKEKKNFLATLYNAYRKAPFYKQTINLVESLFDNEERNVASFISNTLIKISSYLGLDTVLIASSSIEKDPILTAEDRVIDISKCLGATHYINAIGGTELYSKDRFQQNDISLHFLKAREVQYKQFGNPFVPNLSIIDMLMFNHVDDVRGFLDEYDLV